MSTSTYQGSAKIYQFPVHSPRAISGRGESSSVIERASQRMPEIVLGDCWYHDAAVRQPAGSTKP